MNTTSGLKRPFSTDGALLVSKRCKQSDARPTYERKVSFGRLQETVFFDKKDSSSKLSLGVSVSDSSLSRSSRGSSNSNFRWEAQQPPSFNGNASWGQLSSSSGSISDSRWEAQQSPAFNGNASWPCRAGPSRPNMFLQMLNNTPQSTLPKVPTRRGSLDNSGEQDMALESVSMPPPSHYAPPLRPTRRASLTNNDDTSSTIPAPNTSIHMPSLPSRCASPIPIDQMSC